MSNRLSDRLQLRSDYLVLVGVPLAQPVRWLAASSYTATEVITAEGRFEVAAVRAFIVAYPNKQILDVQPRGLPLPADLDILKPAPTPTAKRVDLATAQAGLALVDVRHGSPTTKQRYRTTLHNLTTEPIRVVWFGGFAEVRGTFALSTVTGHPYSADEFIAWYAAPADGWIPPGGQVSDPDNYGGPPILWAYHCETRSGHDFLTGRLVT